MDAHHLDLSEKEKDLDIDHNEHYVSDTRADNLSGAIAAEDQEHMSVLKALKLFPKATFWSFMVSFLIVSSKRSPSRRLLTPDHGSLRQRVGQQHDGAGSFQAKLWQPTARRNLPSRRGLAVGMQLRLDNRSIRRYPHLRPDPAATRLPMVYHHVAGDDHLLDLRIVLRRDSPGVVRRSVLDRSAVRFLQLSRPSVRFGNRPSPASRYFHHVQPVLLVHGSAPHRWYLVWLP